MSEPIVEASGLRRVFRTGRNERVALDGVDLRVEKGELVAVFGPSGAGKTTLLNVVGGLDRPTDGRVAVSGTDLAQLDEAELSALRRTEVGFVFQTFGLVPVLTAAENVEVPLRLVAAPPAERALRVADLLSVVGLSARADHFPDQLSGGEQQRVAIARALANSPALILADEPTAQLDSTTGRRIAELLRDVVSETGATAVVATHDPIVVETADRVVALSHGRVVDPET